MWSRFHALIPYFGGKRTLCPVIFKAISRHIPQRDWPRMTLLDGFCGGGAVSLFAKAQGMRVISNDLADRAKLIIDGLIVNDRVQLAEEDLYRLFVNGAPHPRFVEEHFVPSMFMRRHAQFLDQALHVISQIAHRTKAQLLRLALTKYMLKITPYSQIHSVDYFQKIEDEEFHRLGRSRTRKIPYTCQHPLRILREARTQINKAIFANGHRHEGRQQDIFETLRTAEADICYIDPPYAGAQPYEVFYGVLDQILAAQYQPYTRKGTKDCSGNFNPFNGPDARQLLGRLLDVSRKFRIVILSYGSQRYTFEEFAETIRRVEPSAEVFKVNLRYPFTRKTDAEAVRKELMAVIAR